MACFSAYQWWLPDNLLHLSALCLSPDHWVQPQCVLTTHTGTLTLSLCSSGLKVVQMATWYFPSPETYSELWVASVAPFFTLLHFLLLASLTGPPSNFSVCGSLRCFCVNYTYSNYYNFKRKDQGNISRCHSSDIILFCSVLNCEVCLFVEFLDVLLYSIYSRY